MASNGKQNAAGKASLRKKNRGIAWGRYGAIVLIAAWMFGLGVLVGRGTAPVKFDIQKLTRELENLIAADVKKQLEPVDLETAETKTKTELEFYEELKKSGPIAPEPPPRSALRQPKENPPPDNSSRAEDFQSLKKKEPTTTTTAKKSSTKPVGQSERENQRPATAAAERPLGTTRNVTIQAASLKDLAEADAMVKKLKERGYPAYKTIAMVPGKGIWFRIRVGRYTSRDAAGDVVGKLQKEGYRPILVEAN
ncbi:MAG: SPOR domain-containing protein [Desulfobacterales bacterium]